ncbi:methionine-binding protein [Rhodococcus sp. IEGM 248]|nr:methionine-binding protein [Rhodococcus sp. IEGM 248]
MTTRPRSVTRARAVAAGGLTAPLLLLLTACGAAGGNDRTEGDGPQTTFKIGYTAGSILDEKLAKEVAKLAPDHGITVEPVQIEDSKLKNLAVSQGDIDANHSQHQEWMRVQNEDGNLGLYAAGDWYVLKFSGYSEKYGKLEDLPKGAKVAIPDDPSNQAQALQTLQDLGQLTLKDGVDPSRVTIRDVKDNPKSFEFTEAALAQLPRTLPDVDLALGWRSNFDLADVPDDKIVFNAPAYELYWIEVVINEKNKDNPDFAPLLDTYHDPRIGQLIDSDPFFSRVAQSIESARATDRSQTNVDGAAAKPAG